MSRTSRIVLFLCSLGGVVAAWSLDRETWSSVPWLGAALATTIQIARRRRLLPIETAGLGCLVGIAAGRLAVEFWIGRGPIPGAAALLEIMHGALRFDAAIQGETLVVSHSAELIRLTPSPALLGAPLGIAYVATLLVVGWCVGTPLRPRTLALTILGCLTIGCVRLVAFGWYLGTAGVALAGEDRLDVALSLQHSVWALLLFLPVCWIGPAEAAPRRIVAHPRPRWQVVSAGISILLVGLIATPAEGERKSGRILVDDGHGADWEIAGVAFTNRWRGDMSVYACSALFEQLSSEFSVVYNRDQSISDELLSNTDIVVLKIPSREYGKSEVDALHRFVDRGGGVLAIGDHTNLFNTNTILNRVLDPYGMKLQATSVHLVSGAEAGYSAGWGLPQLESGIGSLEWLTPCDIRISGLARPALVDGPIHCDGAVYRNSSFFGDRFWEPCEAVGMAPMAAYSQSGAGRVLAIGDGTVFTNFACFRPARFELARNAIHWLNHRNPVSPRWRIASLVLLFAAFLLFARNATHAQRYGLLACMAALVWMQRVDPVDTPLEAPASRPNAVFVGTHAQYHLAPTIGPPPADPRQSFDTLFVEFLRYGIRPSFDRNWLSSLPDAEILVIPNAYPEFRKHELNVVRDWVRAGGVLWILGDGSAETRSGTSQILDGVGVSSGARFEPLGAVEFEGEVSRTGVSPAGAGLVFWTDRSGALSRAGLGHPFPVPSGEHVERFALVGRVFDHLCAHLGYGVEQRFTHADN